jgi:hypothetical protein
MGDPGELQAEELLDLAPDDEREVRGEHEQRQEHGQETQAGKAALAHPVFAGAATGSMEPVRPIDRRGIERRWVLDRTLAPGRLCHPGTINGTR